MQEQLLALEYIQLNWCAVYSGLWEALKVLQLLQQEELAILQFCANSDNSSIWSWTTIIFRLDLIYSSNAIGLQFHIQIWVSNPRPSTSSFQIKKTEASQLY